MKLPFILLGFASLFATQSLPAQTFTAQTIVFNGAPQYASADLLTVSGLAPAKQLTKSDVEAGMQRLNDTGLFTDMQYATAGSTLRFDLQPIAAAGMRSVHYTNFVFYKPEELNAQIHARLPLFTGSVPVSGAMQEKVERTLEALLREKGIEASVSSIGAPGGLNYAIVTPKVLVGKLAIEGVSFDGEAKLLEISGRLRGSEYVEGTSGDALQTNLREAYLDLGFVDVRIGEITHGLPRIESDRVAVDLIGVGVPGALYRVSSVSVPEISPTFSASELERATQIKVGGPASRILLMRTIAYIGSHYENQGYLDATVGVESVKNTAAHTVAYTFPISTGDPYHMRNLVLTSFSAGQQSALAGAWKLHPGATYSGAATAAFLQNSPASKVCGGHPVKETLSLDQKTHEVDVVLHCPGA